MNLQEHLLRRASAYWDMGQQLPLDLFYELLGAGLDVERLEQQHMQEPA